MIDTDRERGNESRDVRFAGEQLDVASWAPTTWRIISVGTSSPAASGTGDYETVSGNAGSAEPTDLIGASASSASRQLLHEPLWRSYLRRRLYQLAGRVGRATYPSLETINGAWNVANGVLRSETVTPSILPGDDESVELVWNRGQWHIELEVADGQTYVWAKNLVTGDVVSGDLDETRDVLRDLLAEVSAT